LARIETVGNGTRMFITGAGWHPMLSEGESIAVNGVCLTAVHVQENRFACDVLQETLKKTTLGHKQQGCLLNLERALRLGDPMGGHMVTGHVDGTGVIVFRKSVGRDWVFSVACDHDLMKGVILKGSIACDGVSLTIVELDARSFTVHVIPYTLTHTSLCELKKGGSVNIETDIIGKYVYKYVGAGTIRSKTTMDHLHQAGF